MRNGECEMLKLQEYRAATGMERTDFRALFLSIALNVDCTIRSNALLEDRLRFELDAQQTDGLRIEILHRVRRLRLQPERHRKL